MTTRRTTWGFSFLALIAALTLMMMATQTESRRSFEEYKNIGSAAPTLAPSPASAAAPNLAPSSAPAAAPAPAPATSIISTKWAVLVAGSNGYYNYRHQANVCHAYQILKRGGVKDENIIVFMYDDIAHNPSNPTPGIIINKPNGPDVYAGVPKDYTGLNTSTENLYAVLLGNKSALTGGSGKVLNSGPTDHVFFYYADHGGTSLLSMPVGDYIMADDLMRLLRKMHDEKRYASMVIYLEACEAGSIFQGLLPPDMEIYATTSSNEYESSWGCYCPGRESQSAPGEDDPTKYGTCLGDLYSIAWMEDCDAHDLRNETLEEQYEAVKTRTNLSHVMQYGNMHLSNSPLSTYMGLDATNISSTSSSPLNNKAVPQRDADLVFFQQQVKKAPGGSIEAVEAQKRLDDQIAHRRHVDRSIHLFVNHLFKNADRAAAIFKDVRSQDQPVVDDWDCFKTVLRTYETHCGRLGEYGMQYTRAIANLCNAGIDEAQTVAASILACSEKE